MGHSRKSSQTGRIDATSNARSTLFIGSTEKAFMVLHAFDGASRYMTLGDIAKAAGLDRSSTQRLVHTLEVLGYLWRVPCTREYGLTSKLLHFSYNYIRSHELIDKGSPYLLDVSLRLGETTNLFELDGHEIVLVSRYPGKHICNIDFAVGSRLPAFYTASGLAILSRLPEKRVLEILHQTPLVPMTPYTQTDPTKLIEGVKSAANRGYAVTENQTVLGHISISAPITDHTGAPVAAINISLPTSRCSIERAETELAQHVQVAATSISKARPLTLPR
ncbi:IclR family transcriptional regulator [Paraburkholderia sp. RAU2J]|uniref:IclR family transcriptional regulator n=1 Tax=Paraburkholderia sp. RAU2J TaxID=1938810 RepID=UPI000EB0CDF7|nr:IclR family transcriptional regulator [Paraburkholderia sp. RAU2J]RKT13483.1 IclR family transcriptional regulator [Paraburkholderia sp. RAU2J]